MTDVVAEIIAINYETARRGALAMWTIYDRPTDYPDGFIARMHAGPGGATDKAITGELEEIRKLLWSVGLLKLSRHPDDDAKIVETWL